ncbi:STAS/SEC14 domain-containing protein [Archangium violaceum]|nr:STAS/SEC14 domain-containing protein [Archangium violaceum]
MFQVKVDKSRAIVEVTLEGSIRPDEMRQFVEQSVAAIRDLAAQGRVVKSLADLRHFRATSPEATEILRQGQQAAMQAGMKRIAELVGSELATLQLNRVARASGMDRILRRFDDEQAARQWLESEDALDVA